MATAPINLIYVADTAEMNASSAENQPLYSPAYKGFICRDGYLSCASEGLATVVRRSVNREALKIPPQKKIMLAQAVGYPEK